MQRAPIFDESRTEFGQARSICDCKICLDNCRYMPGFLIPSDLQRMAPAAELFSWAKRHLLASPGAILLDVTTGQYRRVGTLVPARADGACVYLKDNRCTIHPISPFGCAFFDHTSTDDRLSLLGLYEVEKAHQDTLSPYHMVWTMLKREGLVAPGPEEGRKRMRKEHKC